MILFRPTILALKSAGPAIGWRSAGSLIGFPDLPRMSFEPRHDRQACFRGVK